MKVLIYNPFKHNLMMKNIRLVIDTGHLNTHHVQFACYIALLTKSRLTGIFMKNEP